MTDVAWVLLGVAAAFALADWVAVGTGRKPLEYVAKPAVIVALLGVAVALEPASPVQQRWFLAALALSLLGDVFLMLPRDRFIAGLAAFLVAHIAYIGGFVTEGLVEPALGAGIAVAVGGAALVARRVLAGVRSKPLQVAVGVYMVVLGGMLAVAFGSGKPLAAAGAGLFFVSDTLIGWRRFVAERGWMTVTVHVTYHLGQAGLVLSLVG